ncbi:hypothetical protein ACHAQJ_007999 [Trichoderma viride]
MGKLISLIKDVIVDSTQSRSQGQQGQQGRFNNSNFYSQSRQSQKYGYSRDDDCYRAANQRNFDNQGSRPVYSGGNYGRRQRFNGSKDPSPSAYVSSDSGRISPVDPQSLEDGNVQHDSRFPGPTTQTSDELPLENRLGNLPQSSHSDTYPPRPRDRDDAAPLVQMDNNYSSSYEEYNPQSRGPSYVDDLSDSPNYSLRTPEARTLRGSAPRRQYEAEPFIDQGYSSDPHYGSRRDWRRTRLADRRANKSTGRQGIVSLLKDSM